MRSFMFFFQFGSTSTHRGAEYAHRSASRSRAIEQLIRSERRSLFVYLYILYYAIQSWRCFVYLMQNIYASICTQMYSTSQHKPAARTKKIIINTADERTFTACARPPLSLIAPTYIALCDPRRRCYPLREQHAMHEERERECARALSLCLSPRTSLLKCSLYSNIASGELCDYKTNLF